MILFHWVCKWHWLPRIKWYSATPFWCLDVAWFWFQLCIYSVAAAQVLTRTMNHNFQTNTAVLDAEIDKILAQ